MKFKQDWWMAVVCVFSFQGCFLGARDLGYDDFLGGGRGATHEPDGGKNAAGKHAAGMTNGGSSSGGSSHGGGPATCSSVNACGGDVVGSWAVTASCLKVTGEVDLTPIGLGCPSALVTGSLEVSGTWTAYSNGTYEDLTTTSGEEELSLAAECLNISGTLVRCERLGSPITGLGYASVTCEDATGGGCTCLARVEQTAGLGVVSAFPPASGTYAVSGGVLTTSEATEGTSTSYQYCVSGDTLTLTPNTATPISIGDVVFRKRDAP